ncbi:hypothetical protein [Labedaea rhizosphaerae]|uniref:Uncharacterized protein n=1 Tax=Labedaea rhizosphaerae TaxID=598644 RepID=A0A4R6S5U0_LABRH|nr:hypothetical protein [Labedaea rhizosphaerae]TDP95209.1 hypothetical protein EV186_105441 [Labedaea rhizosphaerae]
MTTKSSSVGAVRRHCLTAPVAVAADVPAGLYAARGWAMTAKSSWVGAGRRSGVPEVAGCRCGLTVDPRRVLPFAAPASVVGTEAVTT